MGYRDSSVTRKSLTAQQLRDLLESAELTQDGAARELQISERNMRRYVAGDLPIPRKVEYALRWLIQSKGAAAQ